MKVIEQRITDKSPHWIKGCGNFTQVRILAVLKDSLKPIMIAQFVGMKAKLLAANYILDQNWKRLKIEQSQVGDGEYDELHYEEECIGNLDEKERLIVVDKDYQEIVYAIFGREYSVVPINHKDFRKNE